MIEGRTSPFSIERWYPVVRGGPAPVAAFSAGEPREGQHLLERWHAIEDGERVTLVAFPTRSGARPSLSSLEGVLPAGAGHAERFFVFNGAGGRFALLPARDSASLRGGLPMLPSSEARGPALWTLLRTMAPFTASGAGRPMVAVWTKGAQVEDDLPILPVAGTVAVAGIDSEIPESVTVRALDRRGAPRAELKVGASQRTDDAIAREVDALRTLADVLPGRAPALLAEGERAGRAWLAHDLAPGRAAGSGFTAGHAELLIELGRATLAGPVPLRDLQSFRDGRRHVTALQPTFDREWYRDYVELAGALEAVGAEEIATTAAHGDFTPWSTLVSRSGRVRAVDWDFYDRAAPALADALHYHVQAAVLDHDMTGEDVFDALEGYFEGPPGEVARALRVSPTDALRALALLVLHEGASAEVQERMRRSTNPLATRLRRARQELARVTAAHLRGQRLPRWATTAAHGARSAA